MERPRPDVPTSPSIALLTPAQLGHFKQLRDEALRLHPEAFDADLESEQSRPPESYLGRLGLNEALGGTFLIGAWVSEELVGAIGLERLALPKLRHSAEVGSVMVRPAWAGQGIGNALVQACVARARQAVGLELITVRLTAQNERAMHLYQRSGFQACGVVPKAVRLLDARGKVRHADRLTMALVL